jgi:UDP-GlcNAc:undecaprenyl-phosphate GlcNAc-1-phosphate transferase
MKYLALFLMACGATYALTPLVRLMAIRCGALDVPNSRKVHTKPIPRLGGVGLFLAFHLTILIWICMVPDAVFATQMLQPRWWFGFLVASTLIVMIGSVDDIKPLGAGLKFIIQVVAALIAIAHGYVIDQIGLPWNGTVQLGLWSVPVTLLWIVGLTNAFNLIDGLDGLAAGVALFSTATLAMISFLNQQVEVALIFTVLAGCLLGFLRHNFHPASIFLGDSGSLFLGFTLAVLSIQVSHKSTAAVSVLVPALAFGLPIADTLLAMLRRFLKKAHVVEATPAGKYRFFFLRGRSMFEADRNHLHHRLLKLGFSHRNAVLVLYAASAVCLGMALLVTARHSLNFTFVLMAFGCAAVVAIRKLQYSELAFLRSGTFLPVAQLSILSYEVFQALVDVGLVALAYWVSYLLHWDGGFDGAAKSAFLATLPIVLPAKIAAFYATGLYRIKWSYAGVPDCLCSVKATAAGSIAVGAIISLWQPVCFSIPVLVIDFMAASFLMAAPRVTIHLLNHYAGTDFTNKRKILVYGAGRSGSLLIRELQSNGHRGMAAVGFIDDDPRKQGKLVSGYPVLGTCAQLEDVVRKWEVQELIVAANRVSQSHLAGIAESCARNGVRVRQFHVSLDEVATGLSQRAPVVAKCSFSRLSGGSASLVQG